MRGRGRSQKTCFIITPYLDTPVDARWPRVNQLVAENHQATSLTFPPIRALACCSLSACRRHLLMLRDSLVSLINREQQVHAQHTCRLDKYQDGEKETTTAKQSGHTLARYQTTKLGRSTSLLLSDPRTLSSASAQGHFSSGQKRNHDPKTKPREHQQKMTRNVLDSKLSHLCAVRSWYSPAWDTSAVSPSASRSTGARGPIYRHKALA